MSETSALSQADGATETPAPVAATVSPETPTTLQQLNQAIFDYGAACLSQEVASDACNAAQEAATVAEAHMMTLYKRFQTESRTQGGAK